jgi:hypothetical protein
MRSGEAGSGSISPATVNIDHARNMVKKLARAISLFFAPSYATTVIALAGIRGAAVVGSAWRDAAG